MAIENRIRIYNTLTEIFLIKPGFFHQTLMKKFCAVEIIQ
jgi:hypothetical protein